MIFIYDQSAKSPRRIRLGNDGNLYLGDELVSTTTEKERAVIQELEEGTAKLNNFISNNRDGNGGTGTGTVTGTGVKSGTNSAAYIPKHI